LKLIAEIGQAHEGSLGLAHSYIEALAHTGVDVIKFQTHIAHAESSVNEAFRLNFSYEDATRYDYWKRMEFTSDQWVGLKTHCEDLGMEFVSSPFSMEAVDLLNKIGVKRFKIGSGEVQNFFMIEHIAKTGKDIWLSSGMSSNDEIAETINFILPFGNNLVLFQCTTEYPTKPESWGLNILSEWKERFNLPRGYSDHSGDIFACLAATTLGAEYLEFHTVFDKQMFGPDTKASLTIDQIRQLVEGVRQIESSMNSTFDKNNVAKFNNNKILFGKSLAARIDLHEGDLIDGLKLETKKPGNCGISAKEYKMVLGKCVNKNIKMGQFINWQDLKND
jgi:N,N'-diacetyllegionaminate synthase